jgi:hypothetical protein
LPILPPGVNHMYRITEARGGKALTAEAKDLRRHFTHKARATGFVPDLKGLYGVGSRSRCPDGAVTLTGR